AAMDGRFSVALEDIRKVAVPVLRHRIGINFQAQAEGKTPDDIVEMLLKSVPEPEVPKFAKTRK
ncbi:MAG TPA: AAA family ATPase, partial [Gemmatales bacterium]|nr:AAA family ATPase [Gemmatales bacterium]